MEYCGFIERKVSDMDKGNILSAKKTVFRLSNGYIYLPKQGENFGVHLKDNDVQSFLKSIMMMVGEDWFDTFETYYDSSSDRLQLRMYNQKLHCIWEISFDYGKPYGFEAYRFDVFKSFPNVPVWGWN